MDRAYTDRNLLADVDYTKSAVTTDAVAMSYDAGYRETSRTHGNGLLTTKTYRGNIGDPGDNLVETITVGGKAEEQLNESGRQGRQLISAIPIETQVLGSGGFKGCDFVLMRVME